MRAPWNEGQRLARDVLTVGETPDQPVPTHDGEAGALGVVGLKRFWTQKVASRTGGDRHTPNADDLRVDNLLLAGLRLGLRETLDFLMTGLPSFGEFEAWVLTKNGTAIDPARVERLNSAVRRDGTFVLESILAEPVLSPADLAFWDEHGYVLLKGAVDVASCRAAVDAILSYAGMSLEEPDSWYHTSPWIPLAHHSALSANRNSRRIHTAFAQIWSRGDLWINIDVCGVNPPLRPGYSFQGTPLHWDMTLAPPLRFGTQAILYLTDTAANQGAFSCVPGFHRRIEEWLKGMPAGADPRALAPRELQATPIAGEAGDLIIWHHALPHGATPNRGTSPRVVQYLNMFPSQHEINAEWL
jgi:phytanoyl-CoA dioxygenase PhyH